MKHTDCFALVVFGEDNPKWLREWCGEFGAKRLSKCVKQNPKSPHLLARIRAYKADRFYAIIFMQSHIDFHIVATFYRDIDIAVS